jgi:hypothetical protein
MESKRPLGATIEGAVGSVLAVAAKSAHGAAAGIHHLVTTLIGDQILLLLFGFFLFSIHALTPFDRW